MKKIFAILGIGCGAILVIGLIGMFLAYRGCKSVLGAAKEAAEQQKQLDKLDGEFPFTPPAPGALFALEETRLADYLAIRKSVVGAFKAREGEFKALAARSKAAGDKPSFRDTRDAINLTMTLLTESRKDWIAGLREKRMSPKEFATHTGAIYSTLVSKGLQQSQRAGDELARQIAEAKVKLADPSTKPEEKAALEAQIQALESSRAMIGNLPPGADPAVVAANSALIEKHKAEIEALVNPVLDALLANKDAAHAFNQLGLGSAPASP